VNEHNTQIRDMTRVGAPRIKTWRERIGAAADFPLHAPSEVERAMEAEIAELRASWGLSGPLNGIPATFRHDEGAIARCSYCGRYTLDRKALSNRQPVWECGKQNGWSGSFVKPGTDAKWSGHAPAGNLETLARAPTALAIAAPHFTLGYGTLQLELTDDLVEILGRPNFICGAIARLLDLTGVSKLAKHRAENEQASAIYFLLNMYIRYGSAWWTEARQKLARLGKAAAR
jgi:hypothetical protein